MQTLFIHTDSTGPWNYKLAVGDPGQPHLLRLSLIRCGAGQPPPPAVSLLVYPRDGWDFTPGAVAQHGITREIARRDGKPVDQVIACLRTMAEQADRIAAYGADWHRKFVEHAAAESGLVWGIPKDRWHCVMRAATPVCRVPREAPGGGFAFPKLMAAHEILLGRELRLDPDPLASGKQYVNAVAQMDRAIAEITKGIAA